jgi:hypothetical protein
MQLWLSSSKKAKFNCNMSPGMCLGMVAMEINQLLTMNSLIFAWNNISVKWPFRGCIERVFTAGASKDKCLNKNLVIL